MRTEMLSKTDAAYIAGLIDGEGTVTLTRKHRNENRQLCVSISSTEKPMLDFVKHSTSVGKITNKRTSKSIHSRSYTYAVYNRQALDLLREVLQWLKSYKRERAELILQDYLRLTPRNGKYTKELRNHRQEFVRRVLMIKANPTS
ncbi:MAG: LAGLIDADG family homing endonuclease [Anaerolineae bacterium]|nr:LAGLIDADG family homing endonuclease [Anaerolineae bacterium]